MDATQSHLAHPSPWHGPQYKHLKAGRVVAVAVRTWPWTCRPEILAVHETLLEFMRGSLTCAHARHAVNNMVARTARVHTSVLVNALAQLTKIGGVVAHGVLSAMRAHNELACRSGPYERGEETDVESHQELFLQLDAS